MKMTALRRLFCLLLVLCLLGPQSEAFAARERGPVDPDPVGQFEDVPNGAWYRDAVRYVLVKGYFNGVSETEFAPQSGMTRAMMATVIWRMAGSPPTSGAIPFADVPPGQYYTQAVVWASQTGVINGVTDTTFEPDAAVTRIQTAAMLYRYASCCGAETGYRAGCTEGFPDENKVSDYGVVPMRWAVTHGIVNGRERGALAWLEPKMTITRAEAAAMLWRYDEYIVNGKPVPSDTPQSAPTPDSVTTIWIDGVRTEQCPVWNGVRCMSLAQAASAGGGTATAEGNLKLTGFGHTVYLSKSGTGALIDGQTASLPAAPRYYNGEWQIPVCELLSLFGYSCLEDGDRNQSIWSRVPDSAAIPKNRRVVVLRYHCVSDNIWGEEGLFMSPSKLEAQIVEMKRMGCTFLTFEDLEHVNQYQLPVLLTFDDGYADNYTELLPILKRQNVKATVFMISGHIGRYRYLTAAQLREMSQSGLVSVQSHTRNHADLTTVSDAQLAEECRGSQLDIARITGKIPFALSYPKGMENSRVQKAVKKWYSFGILANTDAYLTGSNPYAVSRFGMPRDITTEQWKAYFK